MHSAFTGRILHRSNERKLREVITVSNVSDLDEAHRSGAICIVKRLNENPQLRTHGLLLQSRKSGEFLEVPAREVYQQYGRGKKIYDEGEWALIQEIEGYARPCQRSSGWAAYIVPADASIGEQFYIPDLIEDLVAASFWYTVYAAETAEAIWNGVDLEILPASYKTEMIG